VAVDGHGNALASTDPADGATAIWTTTPVDNNTSMTALACAATTLCVAGDASGNELAGTPPLQQLAVDLGGTGSGTVTSGDGTISCPGSCSSGFAQGSQVTLTATAASGSTFTGWSGGGCSGTGTCMVTMSADQTVTATFSASPPAGTGSPPPTGTGSPPPTGTGSPPPSGTAAPPQTVAPKPPSCSLTPDGSRVAIKARDRHRYGQLRTLELTALCDQSVHLELGSTLEAVWKARSGKRREVKSFRILTVAANAAAGKNCKLFVRLPAAALVGGPADSLSFTLTGANANGTAITKANIRRLVLV
jgi:hypothetical protein